MASKHHEFKVVVIDLGGVLFAEGKAVAIERLYAEEGYDRKTVMNLLTSPESVQLRKGLIADDEFWEWAQDQLPRVYDAHTIKRVWYDGYLIDKDVLALIKTLRSGYKVIAFSGNIKSRIEYLEQKYRFRECFDEEVYSYEVHLDKPQQEFVQVMIEKTASQPSKIVYIDDEMSALLPAKALGINIIKYSRGHIEELRSKLLQLGIGL